MDLNQTSAENSTSASKPRNERQKHWTLNEKIALAQYILGEKQVFLNDETASIEKFCRYLANNYNDFKENYGLPSYPDGKYPSYRVFIILFSRAICTFKEKVLMKR